MSALRTAATGLAPAHLCVTTSQPRMLALLLAAEDRDVNVRAAQFKGGHTPLHMAAERGELALAAQLLTMHNISFMLRFMGDMRASIAPV